MLSKHVAASFDHLPSIAFEYRHLDDVQPTGRMVLLIR